jgi:hypothetical protein
VDRTGENPGENPATVSQADGIQVAPNAEETNYTVAFALKKNMKKEVALGTWPLLLDWISYLISF